MWNNFVDRFAEIWRNRTMGRKYFLFLFHFVLFTIIELTKAVLLLLIKLISMHKTVTLVKQLSRRNKLDRIQKTQKKI